MGLSLRASSNDPLSGATLGDGSFGGADDEGLYGANGEARFAGPQALKVDQDGDGSADVFLSIDGLGSAGPLTATDFLWQ